MRTEHGNTTTKTERRACPPQHSGKEPGRSGTVAGIAGTDLGNDSRGSSLENGTCQHNDQDRTVGVPAPTQRERKEPGRSGKVADTDLEIDLPGAPPLRTRKNGTCRKEPGRSGTVADTDLGIDLRGAPPLRMAHSNTTTKTERRACPAQHSRKEPGRSGTGADTDLGNDCFAGGSSLGP